MKLQTSMKLLDLSPEDATPPDDEHGVVSLQINTNKRVGIGIYLKDKDLWITHNTGDEEVFGPIHLTYRGPIFVRLRNPDADSSLEFWTLLTDNGLTFTACV